MNLQKLLDPGFEYAIDIDDSNCIISVIWLTSREMQRARKLSTIVIFDTTHKSNTHDLFLGLFVSINEFGKTESLGRSILRFQDTDSFIWLFEKFQQLTGVCPTTLMTDGDLAIAAACRKGMRLVCTSYYDII
jgi:hypothetical protein